MVTGDTNAAQDIFVRNVSAGTTIRVSVDSFGAQSNGDSVFAALSANGRYVVFLSHATNLVAGDANGFGDVFVHDINTGETSLISVDNDGNQGNNHSTSLWGGEFDISDDGRYVAFLSMASNLVSGDTNGFDDVFVHDRVLGTTERVSVHGDGATQGDANSSHTSITADGRYVSFRSYATNLIDDDTNGQPDVFVHDRNTDQTIRVSESASGIQANSFSGSFVWKPNLASNGHYITFYSEATNLVANDDNTVGDVFFAEYEFAGGQPQPVPALPVFGLVGLGALLGFFGLRRLK